MDFISQNKKIVIVPDKFKGCLTAPEVAETIAAGIRGKSQACGKQAPELLLRPMADGGDGSMEVMEASLLAAGIPCRKLFASVPSLLGEPMDAPFLLIGDDCESAFIEMSKVCGLSQVPPAMRDPLRFTTFGLGLLIRKVVTANPIKKLIIAIGGSATNDGGRGLLEALYTSTVPASSTDGPLSLPLTRNAPLTVLVACDVTNPLLGENGATYVYGPQKFNPEISDEDLETGLKKLESRMEEWVKGLGLENWKAEADFPGAGAAGGVGFALHAVLGAKLIPGWKLFSDMLNLEKDISGADLVITGEGRFDSQSLHGKLPWGIAQMCRNHHKPLWLICGQNLLAEELWRPVGITKVTAFTDNNPDTSYCIKNAKKMLEKIFTE